MGTEHDLVGAVGAAKVDALVDALRGAASAGKTLNVPGLGAFLVNERPGFQGHGAAEGFAVPSRRVLVFRADRKLLGALAGGQAARATGPHKDVAQAIGDALRGGQRVALPGVGVLSTSEQMAMSMTGATSRRVRVRFDVDDALGRELNG